MARTFKWLDFKITRRCNNACTYCGVRQDHLSAPEVLSTDTIQSAISDALDAGFTHLAFLGGEPSLRDDFPGVLSPLHDGRRIESVMIITNMLRYNEAMYRAVLGSNAVHAQVVASIDSLVAPNCKHQDPARVLEYVDRIDAIAKAHRHLGGRELHVHSVISRENLGSVARHVSFFAKRAIDVSLALVEPFQIVEKPTRFNDFTIEEIRGIIGELDALEREGILNWANNVLRSYISERILDKDARQEHCTAGRHHVIIDGDGAVYPCLTEAYAKGLTYGNIREEPFGSIYGRMQGFTCGSTFQQTCWDHYLWTRLDRLTRGEA